MKNEFVILLTGERPLLKNKSLSDICSHETLKCVMQSSLLHFTKQCLRKWKPSYGIAYWTYINHSFKVHASYQCKSRQSHKLTTWMVIWWLFPGEERCSFQYEKLNHCSAISTSMKIHPTTSIYKFINWKYYSYR